MRFSISQLFLLIALFFSLSSVNLNAAHIVGGDVTYRFVSFNNDSSRVTFDVFFTMYRDRLSGGAGFDDPTRFGIYRKNVNGEWRFYNEINNVSPGPSTIIPPNDDPCVEEPVNDVAVEQAIYEFRVTLEVGNTDYMISYQRCCRNETIANIFVPGDTGAAFDIVISPEAQKQGNSSPTFDNFPPIFICAGYNLNIDHSATDPEGDVLKYTFCAPFSAGGTVDAATGDLGCCDCVRPNPSDCLPDYPNVTFLPGYSANAPLAGNPIVSINNDTGFISGVPEVTGQFVVGVCVEEFRGGVSLGKIRRDFQFNVLVCERQVFAQLASDSTEPEPGDPNGTGEGNTSLYIINACGDSTVLIRNQSVDQSFIKTYEWEFYDEANASIFTQEGGVEARDANVTFPGIGKYTGRMIINKGIECSDTAPFVINLYPEINADYGFSYDTCVAEPVVFEDFSRTGADSLVSWSWDFGNNNGSNEQFPEYQFTQPGLKRVTLVVEDNNGCRDSLLQDVNYFPAPATVVVEPSSFVGCAPAEITLKNLSFPIDSTYTILWDLGDGNTSSEISPSHTYLEPGNYSLSLDIISPIGCEVARGFDDWIRIKESPVADFSCDPETGNIFNKTISFTDESLLADAWQWNFGGSGNAFIENPVHTFPDTGVYKVLLTVFHPITNCPDTISKYIDIIPTVDFHFPNAFTPNDDASNDEFLGLGFYEGLRDFELSIWNRWGQQIFQTVDPREGWNGMEYNSGKASPQGVYVYKASYSDPRGRRVTKDGHITLLR